MVFQSYALYPHMTVDENMAFALKVAKVPKRRDRRARRRRRLASSSSSLSRPQAGPALGRPAPARRDGPGDHPRAARSSCSTSRSPTSTPSCAAPCGSRSSACNAARHHAIYVTHDQIEAMTMADKIVIMRDGRDRAGRRAARGVRAAGQPVRRRLHRLAADELLPGESSPAATAPCASPTAQLPIPLPRRPLRRRWSRAARSSPACGPRTSCPRATA